MRAAPLALALAAGCGSETSPDPTFCEDRDGRICLPAGVPFAQAAVAATDYCLGQNGCPGQTIPPAGATTAHLSQPEAGRICMSGTTTASDSGLAVILLHFTGLNKERTKITKTFDADALGITQVTFTIDSPPPVQGVIVGAGVLKTLEIMAGQRFITDGFRLMAPPLLDVLLKVTQPGPEVAPFSDFKQTDLSMSATFDTTGLANLGFAVGGRGLDYDFCVRDLKFLDAAGTEITP
jgi:hypothetical protein